MATFYAGQQDYIDRLNELATTLEINGVATRAAAASISSALVAGATVWISGDTYAIGTSRFSPINGQVYRKITGSVGSTIDPSIDSTNWTIVNGLSSSIINIPINNYPEVHPSLNLDFANSQSVDPRITFTRASTATLTNSKGLIESVASGVPRIDFDPVTLECKGLLIEEGRTNLLTYSEQFDNADWSKTRSTVTANAATAPDGTLTADKFVEDATATSTHYLSKAVATSTSDTFSFTVFAKADTRSIVELRFADESFTSGSRVYATFNLATGTTLVGNISSSSVSSVMTACQNGWWKCSVTATIAVVGTVTTAYIVMRTSETALSSGESYTGDGTSGLYIWGAQLEAGAFPTSYIPTTTAQVTRAADVAVMTGANFSSWFNATEGSLVGRFSAVYGSSVTRGFVVSDGTNNNRFIGYMGSITSISGGVVDGSVVFSGEANYTDDTPRAYSYSSTLLQASRSGGAVGTDSAFTAPTGLSQLSLGCNLSGTPFINGHIKSLRYYPKALTAANMQSLSTQ